MYEILQNVYDAHNDDQIEGTPMNANERNYGDLKAFLFDDFVKIKDVGAKKNLLMSY